MTSITRITRIVFDAQRHIVCEPYSIENLHDMAKLLRLKRCWFHNTPGKAHYDVPKRLAAGATAIELALTLDETMCQREYDGEGEYESILIEEVSPREVLRIIKGE